MAAVKHTDHLATKASSVIYKGNDKVLAGVCDGIAQYLEVDSTVARVTCVVLFICTAGIIHYPLPVVSFHAA